MRGGAADRVLRTVSLLFGVGALVFGALTLPSVLAESAFTPAWWTITGLVLILGTAVALAALAPFAPTAVIRRTASAVALGWLLTAATVPFVMPRDETHDQSPWPLALTALGTTAAALAWRPLVAWAGVVVMGGVVYVDRLDTASGALQVVAFQDSLYAMFFAAVFVGLALGALRAGLAVDLALERASVAVVESAVERLRQDERRRVDALVHDRVLATLLLTGRSLIDADTAALQAEDALGQLRLLSTVDGDAHAVPVEELVDRVRAETTELTPFAEFSAEVGAERFALPSTVAEAVLGAVGEALRNVARHAGPAASVVVRIRADRATLEVAVIDDGTGFDTGAVAEVRLGIRSSIAGRMQAVGGVADVRSQAGRGTAVWIAYPEAR